VNNARGRVTIFVVVVVVVEMNGDLLERASFGCNWERKYLERKKKMFMAHVEHIIFLDKVKLSLRSRYFCRAPALAHAVLRIYISFFMILSLSQWRKGLARLRADF